MSPELSILIPVRDEEENVKIISNKIPNLKFINHLVKINSEQKKYIDSYNASVKGNPFKKQIKYKVNKDGSYTVTPPKKK